MKGTCLLLPLFLSGLAAAQNTPAERLHKLFADSFETTLREHPEMGTFIGRTEYNDRWTDRSKPARDHRMAETRAWLKEAASFDAAKLDPEDRLSLRLFRYGLEDDLATERADSELLAVSQVFGVHNSVFSVVGRMPNRTVKDYENLIARMRALPALMRQSIGAIQEGVNAGIVQPKLVVERTLDQLKAQEAMTSDTTPLLKMTREFPSNIPETDRERLKAQAVTAYLNDFLPAWKNFQSYLEINYLPKTRATDGIGGIPGGSDVYRTLVRSYTTTDLTPEKIHETGLAEVKRIEAEMRGVVASTGFMGSLADYEQKIRSAPEEHFRDQDEMLVFSRNVAKIVEPELPKLFAHIPLLLYGVRAIPPDQERDMPTHMEPEAPDGSVPGWFDLNTYKPQEQVRYDKEALVLHEAVPGHMLQFAVTWSLKGLPEFRKYYRNGAYTEGWALYAESLGSQLGVYRTPEARFGQLASERFRAARLVVDTGMHAMGWTRQQALDYFKEHAGEEGALEIDRYIAWPGQALSYKMGELKIMQLREMAQKELGPKFDIRKFHDVVLRDGPLPLEMLEEQVRGWVAHQ